VQNTVIRKLFVNCCGGHNQDGFVTRLVMLKYDLNFFSSVEII